MIRLPSAPHKLQTRSLKICANYSCRQQGRGKCDFAAYCGKIPRDKLQKGDGTISLRDPIRFHWRSETMLRSPCPRRTPREQEGMRGEHWSLALRYNTKGMSRCVRRIYS